MRISDWSSDVCSSDLAKYTIPLGNDLELQPSGRWYFVDDHVLAVDNDPRSVQESYHKFDASLTLAAVDKSWSVSLVGRNLTNKFTRSFDDRSAERSEGKECVSQCKSRGCP